MEPRMVRLLTFVVAVSIGAGRTMHARRQAAGEDRGHGIYAATGVAVGTGGGAEARRVAVPQSNTFLVTTPDGSVVIDTSGPAGAAVHQPLLAAVGTGPVKAVILTHGHGDH